MTRSIYGRRCPRASEWLICISSGALAVCYAVTDTTDCLRDQRKDIEAIFGQLLTERAQTTYGIYIAPDQVGLLWLEQEVLPSEGHYVRVARAPRQLREAIALQSSARENVTAPHCLEGKGKRSNRGAFLTVDNAWAEERNRDKMAFSSWLARWLHASSRCTKDPQN